MEKILVIDGDEAAREEVSSGLRQAGFEVVTADDGAQGLAKVYESKPDLVILADDLPLVNGQELCPRLRQVSNIPIIALGSEVGELAAIRMLELGADTYIMKPTTPAVLAATIHSLRRRYKPRSTGNHCGEDGMCDLTSTESRLLSCLVFSEGTVVSHPQLVTEVWGGRKVCTAVVKSYVRRLRGKRGTDSIVNHRGVGYRFSGEEQNKT